MIDVAVEGLVQSEDELRHGARPPPQGFQISLGQRDLDVWSGRALQEDFVELAAGGLASMYPAFVWSVGSWPSWISARVRSH
jgi:hypothetical protein